MSIKKTAGKILLALYYVQLNDPAKLNNSQIMFSEGVSEIKLENDGWLEQILRNINNSDNLLYNAIKYLLEKGLIDKKNSKGPMGGLWLNGVHLTAVGIDVVEGVEQGEEKQKVVKSLFNFSFNNNVTIDSLVKAEVGNIVGIGVAASGKLEVKK